MLIRKGGKSKKGLDDNKKVYYCWLLRIEQSALFSSATDGKLESERYRLGRVNNGLSDKTKMTFAVCRMADTASVMFCQQDFLRKNKKKRDAGYPVLAPDVLWMGILQILRFYRVGKPVV